MRNPEKNGSKIHEGSLESNRIFDGKDLQNTGIRFSFDLGVKSEGLLTDGESGENDDELICAKEVNEKQIE